MSGGLFYHFRAWRFCKKNSLNLWWDHQDGVQRFLERWGPKEKTLVLIGPSGGYSLPADFLERFERIIAFEIDPVARLIFEKRFGIKPQWIKHPFQFEPFSDLPADAAILFCNLLGQVPFKNAKKMSLLLEAALKGRSWASYHDAMSGENLEFDTENSTPGKRARLIQMKSWVYPKVNSGTLVVNAHQAPELFERFPNDSFFYWQWRILPKRTHLIEGVYHAEK